MMMMMMMPLRAIRRTSRKSRVKDVHLSNGLFDIFGLFETHFFDSIIKNS